MRIRLDSNDVRKYYLIAYSDPAPLNTHGAVSLDAVIGTDGRITELSVRSGDPELARAAIDTVRHWAYRPIHLNSVPVEVATTIELRW